jgi:hypothetical protein
LQQELLQRGVPTFSDFMLPSLVQREAPLTEVIPAYGGTLTRVEEVAAENLFGPCLDIPLLD